ncbi:putative pyridoxal phosphate-dependent aminotransferase EpsN [Clostridia bacterium]|nr:putative pyridoxal phosphate-dependent aminotransferase EpsN [Clostridia bacterium]
MAFKIYLSPPSMGGKEIEYVNNAFRDNWIAPAGPAITEFENRVADYIGINHGVAVTSGTAAMHLIFRYMGIGEGDYVFCSDFTFIGSVDPVFYERVTPIFIDSESNSWNMSPVALQKAFEWAKKENKMPKAVIIVDLYGESADYDSLVPICEAYGVPIIEDAAEAVGSSYKGRKCGIFGKYAVLSFNGNKIITTSGGGMLLTNDKEAADMARFLATQAREPFPWYEHETYGYNYRLSNVSASIGLGQLDYLEEKIAKRRKIYELYKAELPVKEHCFDGANNWLTLLYLKNGVNPMDIVNKFAEVGIESRPSWKPMHMQPVFKGASFFTHDDTKAIDEDIFDRAVCLPSGDSMTEGDVALVISEVRKAFA